jgi:hypothetical protein
MQAICSASDTLDRLGPPTGGGESLDQGTVRILAHGLEAHEAAPGLDRSLPGLAAAGAERLEDRAKRYVEPLALGAEPCFQRIIVADVEPIEKIAAIQLGGPVEVTRRLGKQALAI